MHITRETKCLQLHWAEYLKAREYARSFRGEQRAHLEARLDEQIERLAAWAKEIYNATYAPYGRVTLKEKKAKAA